jgi:hypothetical protein
MFLPFLKTSHKDGCKTSFQLKGVPYLTNEEAQVINFLELFFFDSQLNGTLENKQNLKTNIKQEMVVLKSTIVSGK